MLFFPAVVWTVAPSGAIVAGLSSGYRFEIHPADGATTIVERYWEPAPVNRAHRDYLLASVEGRFRQIDPAWRYSGDPLPTTKAAYQNLTVDQDNRIWVIRHGERRRLADCAADPRSDPDDARRRPCWDNATVIDAFAPDGEYLGELLRPEQLTFRAVFARGDLYYAAVEDAEGLVMVKKFRVVLPGE